MREMKWRTIGLTALVLGVIAGVIPMIWGGNSMLFSALPVAMMFGAYYLAPKVPTRRWLSSFVVSLLTGILGLAVFFIYEYATLSSKAATNLLVQDLGQMPLLVLIISVAGSFFFVKTNSWVEKKRKEMDEKVAAKKAEAIKKRPPQPRRKYKKKKKNKK